jgi:hypothetical protein
MGHLFMAGAGMISLSKKARVAGFLYIVGSLVAVARLIYIPNTLIVPKSATATVNNIARHELLLRFEIFSQRLTGALWIFVMQRRSERGVYLPHPRHWRGLAKLAGVRWPVE